MIAARVPNGPAVARNATAVAYGRSAATIATRMSPATQRGSRDDMILADLVAFSGVTIRVIPP